MLRSYGNSRLFGESYGSGEVRVIWLHGWARQAQDFAAAANVLAESGIGSVALDLPGFGASPAPEVPGGARHYAELILPAIKEIASSPVVLVGHSFGGTVAVVLAAEHPELFSSVVLTGAPVLRSPSSSRAALSYRTIRWLVRRHLLSKAYLERARQKYGSTDYRRAHGIMRDVLVASVNESYEPEIARLSVPVTFLWGAGDRDVPLVIAQSAAALTTGPTNLLEISDVGHLVPLEAPTELAAAALRALGL
ncbi:MAG: alpha/beta hydrolase [Acidimicrobiales bacterium]